MRVTAPGDEPVTADGAKRVLVARKPGVMDPVAQTLQGALAGLALGEQDALVGSFHAEISGAGDVSSDVLDEAMRAAMANEVIEDIESAGEGLHQERRPRGLAGRIGTLLAADDEELMRISSEARSLNLTEMRAIRSFAAEAREPSLAELERSLRPGASTASTRPSAG